MVFKVFISSTQQDLKEYRQEARDAALKTGFMPLMFEHWPASGHRPPLHACLNTVSECDLLIVMVAHRYGWVPTDQSAGEHKSITRLECECAIRNGKEVIAFLVDEDASWPTEQREEYEAAKALKKGIPSPEELLTMRRSFEELGVFKNLLGSRGVRATFRSLGDLRGELIAALNDWRLRHSGNAAAAPLEHNSDASRYLRNLFEITRYIDIRGLQVGSGRVHQFPIEDLYIPLNLKSQTPGLESSTGQEQLRLLLYKQRVVIVGDPGSGKTTLLRRVAHTLAAAWLGLQPGAAAKELGFEAEPPLPFLLRLSDLIQFVERGLSSNGSDLPATPDSPDWIIRFLTKTAQENAWGLNDSFYREKLERGEGMVLLDGFDEAPSARSRKILSRLIDSSARTYEKCQFLITSRPKAYTAETSLGAFEKVEIEPLRETSIQVFLRRWCEALFPDAPALSATHKAELNRALESRPEMRRMATNPVMLTALAVVHWNEKRIPGQRAELYESIIVWLSRAREDRPGRILAERCVRLLQTIALAMQNHPDGRQVEIPRRQAAEVIAGHDSVNPLSDVDEADRFLAAEELDSGIVVARGDNLRFWHLSFQEYLAARALGALLESEQKKLLLKDRKKLLSTEWRETVLLFGGILHRHGPQKVQAMLETILETQGPNAPLAQQAQTVGLVGAIQRDLTSFQFRFQHSRYDEILQRVMTLFEPEGAMKIPLEARLEAADALGQAGDPRLGINAFVLFPGGVFLIGVQAEDSAAPGYDPCALPHEGPPRQVDIPAVRIAVFPVTVGEYERFVVDWGYEQAGLWEAGGFGRWKRPEQWDNQLRYPNRPVVGVSWYEAMAYCRWCGEEVQLPTEVQWERAARGESGRLFPWGQEPPDDSRLHFHKDGIVHVIPVGFYPLGKTPEGLLDMAGNVFEWCRDEWPRPSQTPPSDPSRAVRGGSYRSVTLFVRAAFRGHYMAATRKDFIGFRVCRSAS
jgi:formylglycine-generating enzyme required for sulfatase activity